jgi:uncharacterized protein YqeY
MKNMDTKTSLETSLKDAMRSGDDVRKRTIRMALASIRLAEVEKGGPLDEPAVLSILQKEIKGRRETIQDAQRAMRPDLIAAAEAEIQVLESYLPQQLPFDDLKKMAQEAVSEAGAKTPADMGKVMKILMPRVQGRAPGDQVSLAVRQILQNS